MKDLVLAGFYRATPLLNVVCGNCFFTKLFKLHVHPCFLSK